MGRGNALAGYREVPYVRDEGGRQPFIFFRLFQNDLGFFSEFISPCLFG